MRTHVSQFVDVSGDTHEFLRGPKTWLPLAPFLGLSVGSLRILRVYVNQGCESDAIEVQYEAVQPEHAKVLEGKGWTRGGIEE